MKRFIALVLLFVLTPTLCISGDVIHYPIDSKMIKDISISKHPKGTTFVTVGLKYQYKNELDIITSSNIGKQILLENRGKKLVLMTIEARVSSGVIVISNLPNIESALDTVGYLFLNDMDI